MTRTYVLFEKETKRAVGYAAVEETLLYLVVGELYVAAELREGIFQANTPYKIVDGYAVRGE